MKVIFESSSRLATLEDPAGARLLTRRGGSEMLAPFLGQERTVSQAAEAADTSLLTMYRFVQKALSLGLLEHSRSEPRRGRATRYYRASAEEFFIPYGETTGLSLEALYQTGDEALRERLFKSLLACFQDAAARKGGSLGLRIFRDRQGQLNLLHALGPGQPSLMRSFLAPDEPALWSEWALVQLDLASAKALQEQLYETVRQAAAQTSGVPYLFRIALVPVAS